MLQRQFRQCVLRFVIVVVHYTIPWDDIVRVLVTGVSDENASIDSCPTQHMYLQGLSLFASAQSSPKQELHLGVRTLLRVATCEVDQLQWPHL